MNKSLVVSPLELYLIKICMLKLKDGTIYVKIKGIIWKEKYEKSQVRDIEPTHEMGCLNKKAVPTNMAGKS